MIDSVWVNSELARALQACVMICDNWYVLSRWRKKKGTGAWF